MAEITGSFANVPCSGCRRKHLKCQQRVQSFDGDAIAPCVRCSLSGEACVRGLNVRFKHHSEQPQSLGRQKWVNYPRRAKFCFVDETKDVQVLYQKGNTCRNPADPITLRSLRSGESTTLRDPETGMHHGHALSDSFQCRQGIDYRNLSTPPPNYKLTWSCTANDAAFPLASWREARLMKYYVEYMSSWFDLCDSARHFAVDVPRKALCCPTLLNAIFALSSRHLSLKGKHFDTWISNHYHEQCLRQLSSISNDSQALLDDDLLAATILLRTLEELDVPLLGTDNEGHLLGIQVFMTARCSSGTASSLRKAAFWIGLRQEVTMAVASQRTIKISLSHHFIDLSFGHADDDTWANRIIVHCAKTVQFCFGEDHYRLEEYRALVEYEERWLSSRPTTFRPIAYSEADQSRGEVFPCILYLNHAVVIGVVHCILAQALLMCYDPTLPRVGPSRKAAQKAREDSIREQLLLLCGTALSNETTIPAMITASLGIATCGDRINDDRERRALLGVLVKTETCHGWPTANIQNGLRDAWGW